MAKKADSIMTRMVEPLSSIQDGQATLDISILTSLKYLNVLSVIFAIKMPVFFKFWQARRDLNPQQPVLETGALPIELLACKLF